MSERLHATIVVRPQRAEILCQRLLAEGLIDELTAMECRGYGRQKGHLDSYAGDEYAIDFLPKVVVTGVIAVSDRDRVVDLVCRTARTGRIGDGKIYLMQVEQIIAY